jgi:septum formation inhibitor-activating ATPase MinD
MKDIRDFDDIIDTVGAQLIGIIPYSPILQYASNNAAPIEEGSLTLEVFENIAARLLGQRRKLLIR